MNVDQKGFARALLFVVGVALVGVVSYPIFVRKMGPSTQKTTTTSDSALADETADWKVYNNTQQGFQVRYPTEYEIFWDDEISQNEGAPFTIRKIGSRKGDYVFGFDNLPNFLGGDTGKMQTPEEWNDNQIRLGNGHTKKVIDGHIVYMSKYGADGSATHFRFVKNASTYDMNWFFIYGNEGIGDKIFTTLKFVK